MRKFTVFIEGQETVVNLQDAILTSNYEFVFIKRATVFWKYYDVYGNFNGFSVNGKMLKWGLVTTLSRIFKK